MIPTMCLVQAGQVSAEQEARLRNEMESFAQRSFAASSTMNWVEVPKNSGFTAGQPSTSILVSMQSNRQLEKAERIELLKELCDLWIAHTGRSSDEVVGVIADPQS